MNIEREFSAFVLKNLPYVKSFHPFFNEALAYMLKAGGKHFRAKLLLHLVYVKAPDLLEKAFMPALALECIHTYSLIHDDLPAMDNASLRRGVKTLHKAYDETTAILVGDALNTEAFLLLSKAKFKAKTKLKLVKTLAYNAGLNGMVLGQALDCFFERQKLSLKELEFLHIHKTAKLIAASLKMGCEIANLDKKQTKQIYNLGLKIGLIFQINDDIIDAVSSEKESGKTTQNDTDKNSFVNLLGLERAKQIKESLKKECEKEFAKLDKKVAHMLKALMKQYL